MMNLLRSMGMREFPWTTVCAWVILGLLAAMVIKIAFWRNSEAGHHINLGLALVGIFVGGFLGLCYHVVVQNCGMTVCGG